MTRKLILSTVLMLAGWQSSIQAQFVRPSVRFGFSGFGVSVYRPPLQIYGFEARAIPFGPIVPAPPIVPFGFVESRIIVQVAPRPMVVVRSPVVNVPAPEFDLSGVDLDVMRLPTAAELAGGKPLRAERIPNRDKVKAKPPAQKPPLPPMPKKDARPKKVLPPKKKPKQKRLSLVQLGVNAFKNKQYGLAVSRFRLATEDEMLGPRSHFLLAQAWMALGKYDNAVKAIAAGMDQRLDWPTSNFVPRTELYTGIETEFNAHLLRLQKVVAQHPKRSEFLFLLAYQYWFDGRKAEAAGLFRRARALTKDVLYIDRFLQAAPPGKVAAK